MLILKHDSEGTLGVILNQRLDGHVRKFDPPYMVHLLSSSHFSDSRVPSPPVLRKTLGISLRRMMTVYMYVLRCFSYVLIPV